MDHFLYISLADVKMTCTDQFISSQVATVSLGVLIGLYPFISDFFQDISAQPPPSKRLFLVTSLQKPSLGPVAKTAESHTHTYIHRVVKPTTSASVSTPLDLLRSLTQSRQPFVTWTPSALEVGGEKMTRLRLQNARVVKN